MTSVVKSECPNCHPGSLYCPDCGEKREPRSALSFGNFMRDWFQDITDIDSKLARTLLLLTFKPGFLAAEFSRGVRQPYIRPLRLFIIVALIHFFLFRLFDTADLYTLKSLNTIDLPGLFDYLRHHPWIQPYTDNGMPENLFNSRLKDILSVALYGVMFVAALYFRLLFRKQGRYYTEHLVFLMHIVSAALLRNLVLLPLFALNVRVAMTIAIGLNFIYVVTALKVYYRIHLRKAILLLFPTFVVIITLAYLTLTVCGIVTLAL